VVCDGPVIGLRDLPALDVPEPQLDGLTDLRLDEIERRVIMETLRRYGGNQTAAARHLGVTSRTLHNKLKKYRTSAADCGEVASSTI
jgi:DNA-binding NtrC family response regulator